MLTSFLNCFAYVDVIPQVFRICVRHFSSVSRMWKSFFKCFAYVDVISQVFRLCGRHSSSVARMWTPFLKCFMHVDFILQVCRGRRKIENYWLRLYTWIMSSVWMTVNNELRGVLKED